MSDLGDFVMDQLSRQPPAAPPEPARVRDGHHAPRVEGGVLPEVPANVMAVIIQARYLFKVARNPYADPMWQGHLKPQLIQVKAYLGRMLRAEPDRDDIAVLVEEVRVWLGGRVV